MTITIDERGSGHQIRHYDLTEFEFRDEGSNGFTFEGVASVVDAPYEVRDQWGTYMETIKAGAFDKTLKDSKADVALFVNHDYRGIPLATRNAGTLGLTADPHLRVRATLDPARPDVLTLRSAVNRGEMRQMSVGMTVPKARQTWNETMTERAVSEVKLIETSIVWQGANPLTSASMRSLDEWLESLADVEMDEAELRRAIATFEARLPVVETPAVAAPDYRAELWEMYRAPRVLV